MKAEHINPFLRSLANTFSTMLGCEVERGELQMRSEKATPYPISGVIGLSGKAVGTVVINLSEEVAIKAASTMLMMEINEINDEVVDAVGELANMVAGAAKTELEEYVRLRHSLSLNPEFKAAAVKRIVTDKPLEDSVQEVKEAIWDTLLSKAPETQAHPIGHPQNLA